MRRLRRASLLVALLLVASACGASSGPTGSAASGGGLPSVEVTDLATGDPVALTSVADPGRPTLVWFWAPF